jgi:type I restriction-modification system DNA methylase subunit
VIQGKHTKDLPDCLRDHQGEVIFIDARKMGVLVDRIHRELTETEINRIADVYHNWKCNWERTHEEASKRNICLDLPPPY